MYYLLYWGLHGVLKLYTSNNHGQSWVGPASVTGVNGFSAGNLHAKDDINFVWQKDFGLVDMQVFGKKLAVTPGDMCDNGGCNSRRVIGTLTAKSGSSGKVWEYTKSTDFRVTQKTILPSCNSTEFARLSFQGRKVTVCSHTHFYMRHPLG